MRTSRDPRYLTLAHRRADAARGRTLSGKISGGLWDEKDCVRFRYSAGTDILKNAMDDHELLQQYVAKGSQDSFRELVQRHLKLVYGTALRITDNGSLAEDIAQNVFVILGQKAALVRPPQIVAGWLYNTTRHVALNAIRTEHRRREREGTALNMETTVSSTVDRSEAVELLEPCMAELNVNERDALVLRFMEERSFGEIAQELGVSEDAARMRVNRGLEHLREVFQRRKVAVSIAVLAAALGSTTQASVPVGLGAVITKAVFATTITTTTITVMSWLNAKSISVIVGASILAGTGVYFIEEQKVHSMSAVNLQLRDEMKKVAAQRDAALRRADESQLQHSQNEDERRELMKLRNQVSQLQKRAEAAETKQDQPAPATNAKLERPKMNFDPGQYIPVEEFAFAGYDTPEASLQTQAWAMFKGTFAEVLEAFGPLIAENPSKFSTEKEFMESRRQVMPKIKGFQVLARKVLPDGRIEVKAKIDVANMPEKNLSIPDLMVQPMKKFADGWHMAGTAVKYTSDWEDSNVEVLAR